MNEFLISFGRAGDFGRFRATETVPLRRGDRVVIRRDVGLDVGTVLCPVSDFHLRFLNHSLLGDVLRPLHPNDHRRLEENRHLAQTLFEAARQGARGLPVEIVDVEFLFDGTQATIYHLRRQECDCRALVAQLARQFDVRIVLCNLAVPMASLDDGDAMAIGCGKPDCGQGGCLTCGSEKDRCASCGADRAEGQVLLTRLRPKIEECGRRAERGEVETYLAHVRRSLEQVDFSDRTRASTMAERHVVCRVGELPEGSAKTLAIGKKLIAVFCDRGNYFAIDDTCPHMGASLSNGEVENGIVTCPWHAWRFRLSDGTWADNPRVKIGAYPVQVVGDEIQIEVSS